MSEINYSFVTDIPPVVSLDVLVKHGIELKKMLDENYAAQRAKAIELLHRLYPETDLKQAERFTVGDTVYCFYKYYFAKNSVVDSIICKKIKFNGQSSQRNHFISPHQFHLIKKLS
jgi:hypothetical protein